MPSDAPGVTRPRPWRPETRVRVSTYRKMQVSAMIRDGLLHSESGNPRWGEGEGLARALRSVLTSDLDRDGAHGLDACGALAEMTDLLALAGQVAEAQQTCRRAAAVDAAARRLAAKYLVAGNTAGARDIARVHQWELPDRAWVLVVDHPDGSANDLAAVFDDVPDAAWSASHTLRSDRTVVLVGAAARGPGRALDGGLGGTLGRATAVLRERLPGATIGSSDALPLEQAGTARRQAEESLAVALGSGRREMRFDRHLDPVAVVVGEAAPWARSVLAPLLAYRPTRRSQPDAQLLLDTLDALLHTPTRAHDDLHLHRNTLALRRGHIERLLGVRLADFRHRATISLALRIVSSDVPVPARSTLCDGSRVPASFDDVLALPQLSAWARLRVRGLRTLAKSVGANTLRIWLAHDARFAPTARELDLSEPGVRKRLLRIESALGIPITHKRVNQYDLWLAFRALDRPDGT